MRRDGSTSHRHGLKRPLREEKADEKSPGFIREEQKQESLKKNWWGQRKADQPVVRSKRAAVLARFAERVSKWAQKTYH